VSKARPVITAVLIEGCSQSQFAHDYEVSQSWISRLIARCTLEGDATFEPRSRLPQATIDLVAVLRTELTGQRLDAGPTQWPGTSNTTTTPSSPIQPAE
jgi:hypothetical protein